MNSKIGGSKRILWESFNEDEGGGKRGKKKKGRQRGQEKMVHCTRQTILMQLIEEIFIFLIASLAHNDHGNGNGLKLQLTYAGISILSCLKSR